MASDEEIRTLAVKIALDASSFTQQAAAFKKQVTELDSGFKASVSGVKNWGKTVDGLKSNVETLGKQINIQRQVVESYQGQIAKTTAALQSHAQQLIQNRERVTQLKAAYDQSAATLGKNADETKALKSQLAEAESELSKSETLVRNNQSAIEGYNIQLNNAAGKLNTMEAALKNSNSALFDHTNAFAKAGDALQTAGGKISSVGEKISSAGSALTLGVTTPIVALGTAAENTGINFEAQMSRVQAIAGATSDQLKDLTQTAMDLGAKTTYSDQEVAEGMENLASAGFSVNEITAAMPGMLNLAASSGEDLASSADIAATTLRGFSLAADQTGHVADVLAKNAANTNAAVADTGLAMQYIAPLAQNAGWSLESVTAAIGEMADKGIKGEKAGTALRGALTNLVNPSKDQAAAMKEIGLKAYDANGKMNSLSNIIDQMKKGTEKMTNAQRDQAIATIVGTDALSGMQALISDGSGALDTMSASLKDSTGAAQDMADTMLNNTKGSIEQMKGSVENAGIALSKVLSPTVRDVADKVTDLANKFASSSDATQKQVAQYALLAAVAGPVLLGTGKVVKGIGGTVIALGKGASGVGDFIKGLKGIAPVGEEAIPLLQRFGLALSANPALALATALGLVVAGIVTVVSVIRNAKTPTDEWVASLQAEEKAWKDVKKAADDKAASDLAEINNTQQLWNQLNKLVDENGKVIGNNRDKVQELIDLINGAAGQTLLTMIDGQITRWDKAREAVDKYIDTQKAQILLDAHKDEYEKALKEWDDSLKKVTDTQNKINADKAEIDQWTNNPSTYGMTRAVKIQEYQTDLKKLEKNLGDYTKMTEDKFNTITDYQDAVTANTEGNYNRVSQILELTPLTYKASTGATRAQLEQQVFDKKSQVDKLVELVKSGGIKEADAEMQAKQQQYKDAQAEYDKAVGQAGAAAALIGNTYSSNLNATAGSASAAGANMVNSAISGADSVSTYGIGQKKADEFGSGITSRNGAAYSAGYSAGDSAKNGVIDALSDVSELFNEKLSYYYGSSKAARLAGRAIGDSDWRGGMLRINEEGGEIVSLPQHTQIIPHDISMEIAKAVGQAAGNRSGATIVNVYGDWHAESKEQAASLLYQLQFQSQQ